MLQYPLNNRFCLRGFSVTSHAAAQLEYDHFSNIEQKAILHQFNTASHEALCNYGLRASVALALEESRPFDRLVELLRVPGVGYTVLKKATQRVYDALQEKKMPVQPPFTHQGALEFNDVVSVSVLPGYIAYAHLTLGPGHPEANRSRSSLPHDTGIAARTNETASLVDEILDERGAVPIGCVQVAALDLLPVETNDYKLHPHKLLQKVRAAMHMVPYSSVYAMPVSGVIRTPSTTTMQTAIALQRTQVMGAVQGLLAQRCALQESEIYYVRDTVVHDIFSLRVRKEISANLELLMKLLNGSSTSSLLNWDTVSVPRLTMPLHVEAHFASLGSSRQRTVAPALYTGLVLCSIVAATRNQDSPNSVC